MDNKLIAAGLQPQQAEMYALLMENGELSPPEAAIKLKLTRTNAYKVLDKLVELGLANKVKTQKKFTYQPSNPMALVMMVAEERNRVTAQESAVKKLVDELLERYYDKTEKPGVHSASGRSAVIEAYKQQISLQKPVYFVRSQSDIPTMGFDTMHEIRVLPGHFGQERFGITPDVLRGPTNPENDKRGHLKRTWVKREDYFAPVEWSVSGSILLIVLFGEEPHAVVIDNPIIADAFRQIWQIMDTCLRAMPYYSTLPRTKLAPKTVNK